MSTSGVELLKRAWQNEKRRRRFFFSMKELLFKEQIELVIEKFMFHNLKSEEAERQLSEQEKVFATRGEAFRRDCVLLKLPESYQSVLKHSLMKTNKSLIQQ